MIEDNTMSEQDKCVNAFRVYTWRDMLADRVTEYRGRKQYPIDREYMLQCVEHLNATRQLQVKQSEGYRGK